MAQWGGQGGYNEDRAQMLSFKGWQKPWAQATPQSL